MKVNVYVNQSELKALERRAEEIALLTSIRPTVGKIVQQQVVGDITAITPVRLTAPTRGERCISFRLGEHEAKALKSRADKHAMSFNKYIRTKINNLFMTQ